ncbi:MAG TPA: AMP-binding protein, partial [Streptomyces sp.]|nr:AMP-binding protein [Streptomyces sp.]
AAGGTGLVARLVTTHLEADRGDRIAYTDPDAGEVSYARLHEAARGYAGALRARGVPQGTRCLVVAEDSVATVVALLGLWWHGCVPVPVSPMLDDTGLRFLADDCGAGAVHLDVAPSRQSGIESALGSLERFTGHQVLEFLRTGGPTAACRPKDAPEAFAWPGDREALIQYTSGSTGRPKGVRHSAAGITAMLDGFGSVTGLRPDDTVLCTARMSFGYGFGSSVLCPLTAGAHTVLIRGAVDVYSVRAALERHRPTVLCSVPRMYLALLDAPAREVPPPTASLRLCLSAGEDCPAELSERIRRTFDAEFMNCLGATEVMHVVVATPPSSPMPGSIGLPVPGVTATVRDERGLPVPDGEEGRLHITGAMVALGYLNRPEESRATFADGGAYTGDLVRRLPDGSLQHLCRTDDILNLGGYKVAPQQIEKVMREVEGVADCAVVGRPDANGLEQAVAFVAPVAGADRDRVRRAVRAAVRTGMESYKRPSRIEFVDALPVTTTGKSARYKLRQQAVQS